jgi:serine/threonine protein kinase
MATDYEKLTATLKQKGVNPQEYRKYLNYILSTEFENLSNSLKKKGIDLKAYQKYLVEQGYVLKPEDEVTQESIPSVEATNTDIQDQSQEFVSFKNIGYKLLAESRVDVAELNSIIEELSHESLSPRALLQMLLKKRKIKVEEFIELDQGTCGEINETKIPYRVRGDKSKPEFYIEKQKGAKTFGHYQIMEELARGGMGIIYKAYHPMLNKTFALKVLIAGEDASEQALKRFHREIQATAKLKHPGIIQVVDSGQEGGEHYFAMEYVEGKNVEHLIQSNVSIREGLIVIKKVLEALDYAHSQDIVHRDIKPENIFMTKEGEPKIGDFGLAKDVNLDSETQRLTQTGVIMGTPAYMSPEQAAGEAGKLDARTDIYSVGICLYQLLTKKLPYEGNTVHTLFDKIINEEPPPPSKFNTEVHRDIDTVTLKALEKQKHKRYQSAKEFAEDIGRFLDGYPIEARPASPLEKGIKWARRNKQIVLLVAFVFAIILSFIVWYNYKNWVERNRHFNNADQKAKEQKELADKIDAQGQEEKGQKIKYLLTALNHLSIALSIKPENQDLEQRKLEVGKELIELTCANQEFQLADYVAKEMKLSILKEAERNKLIEDVNDKRNATLREHLKQLDYWKEHLKSSEMEEGEREDAIFEISKMKEKEIYDELVKILNEGTKYFIENIGRQSKLDEYYEIMVETLGRLENTQAAIPLFDALEKMVNAFSSGERKVGVAEQTYMQYLAQALGNTKNKKFAEKLQTLAQKFSADFWKDVEGDYKKLIEVEEEDFDDELNFDLEEFK